MKACPICKNAYEDWVEFCFQDGAPLVAQPGGAAVPAPRPPTLESAPSLPSDAMDSPVPEFGAFDAPEPTLIRMAKLQAAKAAPPSPIAAPSASAVSAYDVPASRPSRGEDLPSARSLAAPTPAPAGPWGDLAPSATEEVLRAQARGADLGGTPALPPAPTPVVRRPAPEPERDPSSEPTATVAPSPPPGDEFEFPRPDEDNRATVPMYTPQPEPPARPVAKPVGARPPRERERERDRGAAVGAPAAAGIGIAMIAAIGLGAVLLVGGGYFFWQSQKKAPEAAVDVAPKPPPKVVKPPPVEPPPEVVPPPVEPPPEVVPPPVEPPPEVVPPPVAPPTKPVTPPTKPVIPPVVPPAKPGTPVVPPTKPVTAPVVAPTSPSDNPWGSTETVSTGKLTITTDPPGGQVTIDGTSRGAAPVSVDVTYGKHKVKVTLPGHKTETSDVNINVQQMSVPFRLAAEVASGIVNVFGPTDGSVFIDGNDLGPLPVSLQVTEGVHTFKLMQGDGKSCQTTRDVRFTDGARPVKVSLGACE